MHKCVIMYLCKQTKLYLCICVFVELCAGVLMCRAFMFVHSFVNLFIDLLICLCINVLLYYFITLYIDVFINVFIY